MKILLITLILLAKNGRFQIPPDDGPFYQGCPEQVIRGDFEESEETDYVLPQGRWYCWIPGCKGHPYADRSVGCKTNLFREIFKAIKRKT